MKYVKKTRFKNLNILMYVINYMSCEEKNKTIKMHDSIYEILILCESITKH